MFNYFSWLHFLFCDPTSYLQYFLFELALRCFSLPSVCYLLYFCNFYFWVFMNQSLSSPNWNNLSRSPFSIGFGFNIAKSCYSPLQTTFLAFLFVSYFVCFVPSVAAKFVLLPGPLTQSFTLVSLFSLHPSFPCSPWFVLSCPSPCFFLLSVNFFLDILALVLTLFLVPFVPVLNVLHQCWPCYFFPFASTVISFEFVLKTVVIFHRCFYFLE